MARRGAARREDLESVIGVFNCFLKRVGEATGGGDGAGALRVTMSTMFCDEFDQDKGSGRCAGENREDRRRGRG
jgi:hypothetical protein